LNHLGRRLFGFALFAVLSGFTASAQAAERYNYTVGLMGGIGGSPDAEPGDELTNANFQLNLSAVTEPRTHFAARLGQLTLDQNELFGSLRDADLKYITLGGEYWYAESFYDSGLFFAAGAYRLEGTRGSESRNETAPGLSVGALGDFQINRHLAFRLELSGHYVNFDEVQFFALGQAGLAIHF
jgi:hypothetical protein